MSREFVSRKDPHSTKFKQKPRIYIKLSFRELRNSNLSGLHSFDNMTINNWVKNRLKTEGYAVSSWDTNPWSNFCDPHWKLISHDKWHARAQRALTKRGKISFISLQKLFSFLKSNFRILDIQISWPHQMLNHKTRNTFYWITWEVNTVC